MESEDYGHPDGHLYRAAARPTVVGGLYSLAMDAGVPVGPPHRSRVVASRLEANLAATNLSVAMYPTVIATTGNAPVRGGLGTGMSNQRHPRSPRPGADPAGS